MSSTIPKCFRDCHIEGCDLKVKHCGINEFPPMTRCTKCDYWFTNIERKLREQEREQ